MHRAAMQHTLTAIPLSTAGQTDNQMADGDVRESPGKATGRTRGRDGDAVESANNSVLNVCLVSRC